VLIATDLASRGLDIPNVELIIHYHVPKVPSVYVHRCGRSGRGKAAGGKSVLLVSPQETVAYMKIVDLVGDELPDVSDEGPHYTAAERRVVAAKKLEQEMNKASKAARHKSWVRMQSEAMELALDSDEEEGEGSDDEMGGKAWSAKMEDNKRVQQMRTNLDRMLDSAILPTGVSPRFVTSDGSLPEMLSHGARSGSMNRFADGARVHRKKNTNPRKFGRK